MEKGVILMLAAKVGHPFALPGEAVDLCAEVTA